MECTVCGEVLAEDAKSCPSCGLVISRPKSNEVPVPRRPAAAAPPPKPAPAPLPPPRPVAEPTPAVQETVASVEPSAPAGLALVASFPGPEEARQAEAQLAEAGFLVNLEEIHENGSPAAFELRVNPHDADNARAVLGQQVPISAEEAETIVEEEASPELPATTPPPAPEPTPAAAAPKHEEIGSLRSLESRLSSLIDDKDVEGWTVNPAYHPDVRAFIETYTKIPGFKERARFLQQNRARYFATMRARATVAAAEYVEDSADVAAMPMVEMLEEPDAPPAAEPVAEPMEFGDLPMPPADGEPAYVATPAELPVGGSGYRMLMWIVVLVLLVPTAVILGVSGYFRYTGEPLLAAATSRLDTQEPNWRWQQFEDGRAAIDDEANAALIIGPAAEKLPADWPGTVIGVEIPELAELPPEERLGKLLPEEPGASLDGKRRALQVVVSEGNAAAEAAARLPDLAAGRYPAQSPVVALKRPKEVQPADRLADLIRVQLLLAAADGNHAAALRQARGLLALARAVGDDPAPSRQARRIALQARIALALEDLLMRGEPDAGQLAEIQKQLTEEQAESVLARALRGERAAVDHLLRSLENIEDVSVAGDASDYAGRAERWLKVGYYQKKHAEYLDQATAALKLAEQPVSEWASRVQEFALPETIAGILAPIVGKDALVDGSALARQQLRSQALLRTAIVALALERYRLAHERWPEKLDQLVPDYLEKVPVDPYTGDALKLRMLEDGVVVYSVGPDGQDHEGNLNRFHQELPDADLGFRLKRTVKTPMPMPMPEPPKPEPWRPYFPAREFWQHTFDLILPGRQD